MTGEVVNIEVANTDVKSRTFEVAKFSPSPRTPMVSLGEMAEALPTPHEVCKPRYFEHVDTTPTDKYYVVTMGTTTGIFRDWYVVYEVEI